MVNNIQANSTKDKQNKLPIGWEKRAFKSFSKFFSGGTPSTSYPHYYIGNIRFIKSGEIYSNKTKQFISEEGLNNSSAKLVDVGDLLYALYGANSGEVAISQMKGAINQAILCIRPLNDKADTKYLYNYLVNQKEKITSSYLQGGQGNLSADIIKSLVVPLPPLPEQIAIANILSTWDNAIQLSQNLISQKEAEKKWLMQNLLTGKLRLRAASGEKFSGEWKELRIKDISKEVSIRNKTDKELVVLSCTKYNGLVPSLSYFGRKIYSDDLTTYKIVPNQHFAYATNHIEEGSIGYQDMYEESLISPMYTVFKTNESINDSFFFKVLKSHDMVSKYQSRMEGSIDRRGGLRWSAFSIIKVKLPSFEEQTAIAQVLQTADQEIEILKNKLDQQKLQKKGLMQVLLTGKIRVK
jgi:type I restriction enzyme S subunit